MPLLMLVIIVAPTILAIPIFVAAALLQIAIAAITPVILRGGFRFCLFLHGGQFLFGDMLAGFAVAHHNRHIDTFRVPAI